MSQTKLDRFTALSIRFKHEAASRSKTVRRRSIVLKQTTFEPDAFGLSESSTTRNFLGNLLEISLKILIDQTNETPDIRILMFEMDVPWEHILVNEQVWVKTRWKLELRDDHVIWRVQGSRLFRTSFDGQLESNCCRFEETRSQSDTYDRNSSGYDIQKRSVIFESVAAPQLGANFRNEYHEHRGGQHSHRIFSSESETSELFLARNFTEN